MAGNSMLVSSNDLKSSKQIFRMGSTWQLNSVGIMLNFLALGSVYMLDKWRYPFSIGRTVWEEHLRDGGIRMT